MLRGRPTPRTFIRFTFSVLPIRDDLKPRIVRLACAFPATVHHFRSRISPRTSSSVASSLDYAGLRRTCCRPSIVTVISVRESVRFLRQAAERHPPFSSSFFSRVSFYVLFCSFLSSLKAYQDPPPSLLSDPFLRPLKTPLSPSTSIFLPGC